jgi:hypothetical protein
MLFGRSVRLPTFLEAEEFMGEFSFWPGEPVRYNAGRFLSITPPATGIFVGEGVRGEVLNFSPSPRVGEGDEGELPLKAACAIRDFRSESELRRFFLSDLVTSCSSGGGEAPMVLSLLTGP